MRAPSIRPWPSRWRWSGFPRARLDRVAQARGRGGGPRENGNPPQPHPSEFGSFVLLGTVLIAEDVEAPGEPLAFNPCLECKLCVAACPVGAIKPDGAFDFSACLTHNYQQFMGGFVNFVEDVAAQPLGRRLPRPAELFRDGRALAEPRLRAELQRRLLPGRVPRRRRRDRPLSRRQGRSISKEVRRSADARGRDVYVSRKHRRGRPCRPRAFRISASRWVRSGGAGDDRFAAFSPGCRSPSNAARRRGSTPPTISPSPAPRRRRPPSGSASAGSSCSRAIRAGRTSR